MLDMRKMFRRMGPGKKKKIEIQRLKTQGTKNSKNLKN